VPNYNPTLFPEIPANNPRITQANTTLSLPAAGGGLTNPMSSEVYCYDALANRTDVFEYGYEAALAAAPGSYCANGSTTDVPTGWLRHTHRTLLGVNPATGVDYRLTAGVYLPRLPQEERTDAAGNAQIARTQYFYDEAALTPRSNASGWSDPGRASRGNLTRISRWLDTTNTYLDTRHTYDTLGNAVDDIDARSYTAAHYDYSDCFGPDVNHCGTGATTLGSNSGRLDTCRRIRTTG